jgi:hypothetical protein
MFQERRAFVSRSLFTQLLYAIGARLEKPREEGTVLSPISGLELLFDSLTQGDPAFALGYSLSGLRPFESAARSRHRLRFVFIGVY